MKKAAALFLLMLLLLIAAAAASGCIGAIMVDPFNGSYLSNVIVWQIRMPRVIMAAIAGAMLSMSGALLQSSLRNDLSDPYILGVSSGGGVGAAAAIVFSLPFIWVSFFAFAGALLTVLTVYRISRMACSSNPAVLILAGVAVSSLLGALLTILAISSDDLYTIYFWILGTVSGASWHEVSFASFILVTGTVLSMTLSRKLNAMALGDEDAMSLGIDAVKLRLNALSVASLMSGTVVALTGMIGFVGLMTPHMVRAVVGNNNVYVIPLSAVSGALLLVLSDLAARMLLAPADLPLGIITSLLGAPFFIWLLVKRKAGC